MTYLSPHLRSLLFLALLAPLAQTACSSEAPSESCEGAKCDVAADFASQLEGKEDPIAQFMRTLDIDAQGRVAADFGTFAEGIAEQQGCGVDSWKSFVVSDNLVSPGLFPRVVSTVCSDNPRKASEFFIAASFKHPTEEDIDTQRLEMFAWDAKARQYRFYASETVDDRTIELEVDPDRCKGCHLTPAGLPSETMRMTPIMNELTQPWSHWNSEVPMFSGEGIPFRNHDFEAPLEVRDAEDFVRYSRDRVGAAQELEAIIREGHDRVGLSRSRDKRGETDDWRVPMNLIRPLFCEEQVNYATEDFGTGLIRVTALIPGGTREAYRAERPDNWPWQWLNNDDERIRLAAPNSVEPLTMMPVRGNADIGFENRLMTPKTTAVFTPSQLLQVRALDWKRPVFSDFRCGLWKDARARFEQEPPTLPISGKVNEAMRALYDEVLTIDGVAITSGDPVTFISLPVADDVSISRLKQALEADALSNSCGGDDLACRVDFDVFGDQLDAYVTSLQQMDADEVRTLLQEERNRRLCHVLEFFRAAPALPAISCEESPTEASSYANRNDDDVAIPDNDETGATSVITVRGDAAIPLSTVEVSVQAEHTWRGDLAITLTAPTGETRDVHLFESGDSDDGVSQSFSVAGFPSGMDARGDWTLRVVDRASQDTGSLLGWGLGINTAAP